jgi:hypothetical protein
MPVRDEHAMATGEDGVRGPGRLGAAPHRSSGASLPGERGEVAAALITGERAGISEEDNQAMRDSGLFHVEGLSFRSESVAETCGWRPWVPDQERTKAPSLTAGQAYARDQGAFDEGPDQSFDGNSEG